MKCSNKECDGIMYKIGGTTYTKWESYYTYKCDKCNKEKIVLIGAKIKNKEV